jgi:hypothetical protein
MKLTFGTKDMSDAYTGFYADIPEREIGQKIVEWWPSAYSEKWKQGNDGFLRLSPDCYPELGEFKTPRGGSYRGDLFGTPEYDRSQPILEARQFKTLLAIRWFYTIGGIADPGEDYGWMFFTMLDGTEHQGQIKIPDGCSIDMYGNMLISQRGAGGEAKLFFPALLPPWPQPILSPKRFEVIGALNMFLRPDEENPLSALLRSPSPYRNLAKQVLNELKMIESMAVAEKMTD